MKLPDCAALSKEGIVVVNRARGRRRPRLGAKASAPLAAFRAPAAPPPRRGGAPGGNPAAGSLRSGRPTWTRPAARSTCAWTPASTSERLGLPPFVSQQIYYSLQGREAEYELIPLAVDQGLGILVWSPLAGGLLSGKYRRGQQPPEGSRHLTDWGEPSDL